MIGEERIRALLAAAEQGDGGAFDALLVAQFLDLRPRARDACAVIFEALFCGVEVRPLDPEAFADLARDAQTRPYVRYIVEQSRSLVRHEGKLRYRRSGPQCPPPLYAGPDFDVIIKGRQHEREGNPFHLVNLIINLSIEAAAQVAVVTSVRNEGPYLLEWIAYYRALGVDRVIVYGNDNDDGSDLLLDRLHELGEISYVRNVCDPRIAVQVKAFRHAIHFNAELRDHEWVIYCDADEFLVIPHTGERPIRTFLDKAAAAGGGRLGSININWRWFTTAEVFAWRDGLALELFRDSRPDPQFKSVSRVREIVDVASTHYPTLRDGATRIDGNFQPPGLRKRMNEVTPAYGEAQFNHYSLKSFEEFAALKKARGRGSRGIAGEKRSFSFFFRHNKGGAPTPLPEAAIAATGRIMKRLVTDAVVAEAGRHIRGIARMRIGDFNAACDAPRLHALLATYAAARHDGRFAEAEALLARLDEEMAEDSSFIRERISIAEAQTHWRTAFLRWADFIQRFPREAPRNTAERLGRILHHLKLDEPDAEIMAAAVTLARYIDVEPASAAP